MKAYCRTHAQGKALLEAAFEQNGFQRQSIPQDTKGFPNHCRLEGSELIKKEHIGEALSYRAFDKKYWS